jgi:flagellum-specific ATP synthase
MNTDFARQLDGVMTTALAGSVVETTGMTAAVADFPAPVGSLIEIERQAGPPTHGEVIGFRDGVTVVHLLAATTGVRRGSQARLVRTTRSLRVGSTLLGRVVEASGRCIDGRPQPVLPDRVPLDRAAPSPIDRPRIHAPLGTGVRAIDALLTCGRGQRLGIFSGSGVGKSVLMGMMTRYTDADVIVTGLIGERGREVNEFIQRDLGPQGLARSVVVVATSNEPALARVQAAATATAIAEYFRDQGRHVLLLMDSITRYAMALREIGLAAGEPPTTRGYPPSMYAHLPRLVERAGLTATGSITAFYTVLVEGDDETEPVADTMRGLLDGHIWLSRKLAGRGHYPAVDVLASISRLMNDITTAKHQAAALVIRQLLAAYAEHEDLVSIGAYRRGTQRSVDVAIEMREAIEDMLKQPVSEPAKYDAVVDRLVGLAAQCQAKMNAPASAAPVIVGRSANETLVQ